MHSFKKPIIKHSMSEKKLNLLADFPAVSTQEWKDKITADLKGADFNKRLVWKTNEGFNVMPFYRAEDIENFPTTEVQPGGFPYVRGTKTNNEWFVRQNIVVKDVKEANAKALDILNKGVNSLGFKVDKTAISPEFIAALLEGINAECVELNFQTCVRKSSYLMDLLINYYTEKQYDVLKLEGSINFDPMNSMQLRGKNLSKEEVMEMAKTIVLSAARLPFYRVIGVNAVSHNNAGAFAAQELGYALAWGNEYLSSLVEAGVDTALAAKKIKFNFGVGSNYFMEIAKFRAAKWLWALIVEAYQPACRRDNCELTQNGICFCAMKMRLHAETSEFNKTIYDSHVNLLRTQTEAMSASLGGVNSLTVLPFDIAYQQSNEISERIARNQQLLLKEESNFDKIIDPAGGSYYVETLTTELASQAWKLFLEIEDKGGFFAAIKDGTVQKAIKSTADNRLKNVASRREILLGTNQFPNFSEIAGKKVTPKADCGCNDGHTMLPNVRAAQEFESLRFATEAAARRPKVFMLTIGSLAMRLARAQFSSNLFACAGYEIVDNLGFKTVEEGVEAARKVEADIIVLCSSDDEYVEFGVQAINLTKGNEILVVAGAPACTDDLKAAGVEHFISVKTNVLEALKGFNSLLNI